MALHAAFRDPGLRRLAFAMALVLAGLAWAAGALAQGFSTGLPPAAQARLVDRQGIDAAFAAAPSDRLRVIVEFAAPELPSGVQGGTPQADSVILGAVRTRQDQVLARAGLSFADPQAELASAQRLRRMPVSPMFALDADPALLARLAQDPVVVRIHIDQLSRPLLTQSLQVIGMPAAYAGDATGNGQVVAVLDSGARLSHEFLASRIVAGACFNTVAQGSISRCPGGVTAATTLASSDDCTDPTIFGCGHGTHVSGIAAGFLPTPRPGVPAHGVARDARILSINVFAQFPGNLCGTLPAGFTSCILSWSSDQIAALNHVYTLRNTYAIAAVNMSLGGGQFSTACTSDPLRPAVQQLRSVGIAVIAATGNDGFDSAISAPACIPEVIAVGSSTNQDVRSGFSNWGPLVDLVAPGSQISASYINGTSNNSYAWLSGTSMATPHVAGAFAALRSAAPTASIDSILAALQSTGASITSAGVSKPRINVDQARGVLAGGTPTTTSLAGPASSVLSQPVTLTATVTGTGGTPTGSVAFRNGGVTFATAALNGAGVARVTTYALPAGAQTITALYLGGGGFQGSQSSALSHTVSQPATPVNDAFATAIPLPGAGVFAGSTTGATAESGEPNHASVSTPVRSVWWRVTPTASGTMTVNTCGSGLDTTLAVYTGTAVNALVQVASNDDSCGTQSQVSFAATAGTTYRIAVAGWSGATGAVLLNATFTGAGVQPTTTTLAAPATGQTTQVLSFTATVAAASGVPTGTVIFRRDGVQFASAALNGAGQAIASGTFAAGTYTLTAEYQGVAAYAASTSAGRALSVTAPPGPPVDFRGGGAVFGWTAACAAGGWPDMVQAVELRYGPGEVNGFPTQTAILFRTGSEHLQVWEPFVPTTSVFNGLSRQMWSFFVLAPDRPRVRPVQRRITLPEGGTDIAAAQEVMLRLRVENWGGIVGCGATVAGTLHRMP